MDPSLKIFSGMDPDYDPYSVVDPPPIKIFKSENPIKK